MIFRRPQVAFTFLITSILLLVSCSGDGVTTTWTKTFGGTNTENAGEVKQTSDGGYIFTGTTNCNGGRNCDVYLAKIDENGNIVWERTYGGADNDFGISVQESLDRGYVVLGTTSSFGNVSGDIYLIKTDGKGEVLWQKTYGGERQQNGSVVRQTSDGGYIIVGSSNSFSENEGDRDVYLIKTDGRGEVQWEKTYGGPGYDDGISVQQTLDGGYIIVGRKASFREGIDNSGIVADVYLIKTDEAGNALWEKTYGGKGFNAGGSVLQTEDGGYFVTGITSPSSTPNEHKAYLIKTDENGNELWERAYWGFGDNYDPLSGNMVDARYFVAGDVGWGAATKIFLAGIDESGNVVWERTYGATSANSGSAQRTRDSGYIISGITNIDIGAWITGGNGSDFYLIKTDCFGNTQ